MLRRPRAVLALTLALAGGALVAPSAQAAPVTTVRGTVTVTGGAVLRDAFVSLVDPSLEPDPEPRSIDNEEVDSRGGFSLEAPRPGRYELAVEDLKGRWAPKVLPITVGTSGTVQVPVRLDRGRTVTGRVVRGDGAPAVGRVVLLWNDDSPYGWTREAVTDAAGRFTAAALTAGRHRGDVQGETATDATWASQCLGGFRPPAVNWYDHPDAPTGPGCDEKSRVVDTTAGDASAGTETLRHRNAFVTGVVRDLAGRGVGGIDLAVRNSYQADNDFDAVPWQRDRTDAQGRYRVMVDEDDSQHLRIARYRSSGALVAEAYVAMPTPGLGRTATRDVALRIGSGITARTSSTKRGSLVVRVRVKPVLGTGSPSGTVTVRYKKRNGKAATANGTLDRTGLVRVRLTKVRSGTRSLTVRYAGSIRSGAAAITVRARVR